MTDGSSLYEAVGGRDTFVRLVDRLYDGVAADPVLRACTRPTWHLPGSG